MNTLRSIIRRLVNPLTLAIFMAAIFPALATAGNQNKALTLAGDEGAALYVWPADTNTSCSIQVTSVTLLLKMDNAADTSISSDGTITFATTTENTIGEIVDLINADANWNAIITGSIRSASSANLKILAATAVTQAGIDLYWDHGDNDLLFTCIGRESDTGFIGPERLATSSALTPIDPSLGTYGQSQAPYPAFSRLYRVSAISTTTGGYSIDVYRSTQSSDTLIWSWDTATATATDKTFDPPADLQSKPGERLVIEMRDTSGSGALTANYMYVFGGWE